MASSRIGVGVVTMLLVVLVLGVGRWVIAQSPVGTDAVRPSSSEAPGPAVGFLHGQVITDDGTSYEGRLRFGGNEEALWSNYFNGAKVKNPWAEYVAEDELPTDHRAVSFLGFELGGREVARDLRRPFMVRFGDIVRIEARGRELSVTLKSGTVVELDRFGADDFADGLTLWDGLGQSVRLGEWGVRSIDFTPAGSPSAPGPMPLHGTVRTSQGEFTGLIQWDREEALTSDVLTGRAGVVEVEVPFERIESISRTVEGAVVVTHEGETLELSGTRKVGDGHRGVYVDDVRYGRILVAWRAFERVDFTRAPHPPHDYDHYAPGAPLQGTVVTQSGETVSGRLVFDLDESETTETLDAPWGDVDFVVPFDMIASVEAGGAVRSADAANVTPYFVALTNGEVLQLEPAGDLAPTNAGLLVFEPGAVDPDYVPWSEVRRIEFEAPHR